MVGGIYEEPKDLFDRAARRRVSTGSAAAAKGWMISLKVDGRQIRMMVPVPPLDLTDVLCLEDLSRTLDSDLDNCAGQ
jgi:hypothetical protein